MFLFGKNFPVTRFISKYILKMTHMHTLTLPLVLSHQLVHCRQYCLSVLCCHLIILVPVVVAAQAAVLSLDGWGRDNVDEVSVEYYPHSQVGVNVVGAPPLESVDSIRRKLRQ